MAILDYSCLHMNFRTIFSITLKETPGILIGIIDESMYQFGDNGYIKNIVFQSMNMADLCFHWCF